MEPHVPKNSELLNPEDYELKETRNLKDNLGVIEEIVRKPNDLPDIKD